MSEAGRSAIADLHETSFEEFVAGSSARLFTMARLLTGGHRAEAENPAAGCLRACLPALGADSRRADPERYVRQMLVNASVDRWRRLRRHPETELLAAGADPGAADATAAVADRDLLLRGLAALPPRQRAALVLRYFEDLSEAQAAATLGCSVGTIKSQTARGLAKLREITGVTGDRDSATRKGTVRHDYFERWLRAAMTAATEPSPAGLLAAIRHRHRRHLRRVGAACVAGVAAAGIAVPLVTRGMLAGPARAGSSPAVISPAAPTSQPAAAPGTVHRDCQSSNNGTLGSRWKAAACTRARCGSSTSGRRAPRRPAGGWPPGS